VIGPLRLIYIPGKLFVAGHATATVNRIAAPQGLPFRHRGRPRLRGDEYRMTGSSRELIVLSMNLRTYDATKQSWNVKWLNALAGTCGDLGPEELARVAFNGQSIIYASNRRWAPTLMCAPLKRTFPKKRFTRRGEKSDDGNTWSEFMVVEAYRSKQKQPILSRTTGW
jgi:hypothetical protein